MINVSMIWWCSLFSHDARFHVSLPSETIAWHLPRRDDGRLRRSGLLRYVYIIAYSRPLASQCSPSFAFIILESMSFCRFLPLHKVSTPLSHSQFPPWNQWYDWYIIPLSHFMWYEAGGEQISLCFQIEMISARGLTCMLCRWLMYDVWCMLNDVWCMMYVVY